MIRTVRKKVLLLILILSITIISLLFFKLPLNEKKLVKTQPPSQEVNYKTTSQTVDYPGLTFAVFGDNRPPSAVSPQLSTFKKILTQIKEEHPDFIVCVGDMVFGSPLASQYRKQYQEFYLLIKEAGIPFYAAVGNHDAANQTGVSLFKKYFSPQTYYSFSYQNLYFIFLNTEERGKEGTISGNQLTWLESELKKNKGKIIFIFLHRPLYSVLNPEGNRKKHLSFTDKENEIFLKNLFEKYGVEAVFAGHEHLFNYQKHDNTNYFITGCAGAFPYVSAKNGGFPHHLLVKISSSTITYTLIKESGEQIRITETLLSQ